MHSTLPSDPAVADLIPAAMTQPVLRGKVAFVLPYAHHSIAMIAIIDDDRGHLELLRSSLTTVSGLISAGALTIGCFTSPADALAALPTAGDVVVICSYQWSGPTGTEMLRRLCRQRRGPVLVTMTSGFEAMAGEALRSGATDYLVKTEIITNPERAARVIGAAVRCYRLEHRVESLSDDLRLARQESIDTGARLRRLTEIIETFVEEIDREQRRAPAGPVPPYTGEEDGNEDRLRAVGVN